MIKKVKSYFDSPFVKVSFWSGIASVIKMGTGFVTLKVLAIYTGVSGIALYGQLSNAATILINLASGGINTGVTKFIAEHSNDNLRQETVISTSFKITIVCSVLTGLALFVFCEPIARYLFKTDEYDLPLRIFSLTIIFYALNNLILSIINGYKAYKQFIFINIISSLFIMAFTLVLVYYWSTLGALIAFVTAQSVVIFVTLYFVRNPFAVTVLKIKFDRRAAYALFGFSLTTLVTAFMNPASQIVVRNMIANEISIDAAGIWEGLNRLSITYLMIIQTSIQVYYLPRLAEIKSRLDLVNEVVNTYKIVLPPLLLVCVIIFFTRDIIVQILFTSAFYPMRELFAVQLAGDFMKVVSLLMAFVLPARGLIKHLVVTEIIFNVTFVMFTYFFVSYVGFEAIPWGYFINYLIYAATIFLILRAYLNKHP